MNDKDFSSEAMAARGHGITHQTLKENKCQPRILDPAKLSFRNQGGNKTFSDAGKVRELVSSRPTLKECLKDALETQREMVKERVLEQQEEERSHEHG